MNIFKNKVPEHIKVKIFHHQFFGSLVSVFKSKCGMITFKLCKSACPNVGGFINLILCKNNLISVAPEFTDGVKSSCVGVEKSFSLWLNLEAQPDVGSNFSWTKDGVAYQGDVSATALNISNVALGDAGVYNVSASNSVGSDSYSFTLTVTGEFTIIQ